MNPCGNVTLMGHQPCLAYPTKSPINALELDRSFASDYGTFESSFVKLRCCAQLAQPLSKRAARARTISAQECLRGRKG